MTKNGLFSRLKQGLKKTKNSFVQQIESLYSRWTRIDEELFEELEEILITSDVGVETTMKLVDDLRDKVREEKISDPGELNRLFQDELKEILDGGEKLDLGEELKVLMVVGVNGSGKTTTIAKLAQRYQEQGKKVLFAAADTFRAAAIDQIKTWGDRLGIDVIAHQEGADAAAVAFDAVQAARARGVDLLIVDTAGRLHTRKNLMEELKKVRRVIGREVEEDQVEVLLVIDATTGQNAVAQAHKFHDAVGVDGIALTKLDGTAKGGIIISIRDQLGLPIWFVGVGEAAEDLQEFDAETFVSALFAE